MQDIQDRRFTAQDKLDLLEFLDSYNRAKEPSIGHYPANLHYSRPGPDPHYYQAQGVEPPKPKKLWFRNNVELTALLSSIALLLLVLALCPAG